ncbi:DUF3047 domain-containing protein [Reinekea marinisedimentorum]|uniref:DUF3047 family protein n=1 Tax=Reinekea marinisedimentorum TaxID=230495 RepID=A0A4R3I5Y5_9GAMM|nr:DUF3047 domain-containing protein [Reinekea marinisedimentorum]TCS41108.1 Protein of unknown function (DUF3047) [Reinekea marinisedimentorum]
MKRFTLFLTATTLTCSLTFAAENLTDFANANPADWKTKAFVGETQYSLTEQDGTTLLKAEAESSASGIIFEEKIDLQKTPYINWQWLIESKLADIDEQSKEGDDYVARVYVVLDGGLVFWNTKALTYVWSSTQQQGTEWDNAYTGDAVRMVALRGSEAETGQWYNEKRNVYEDLIAQFGDRGSDKANLKKYRYIDATVIMTDTDNSGGSATAYYGDIVFTEN